MTRERLEMLPIDMLAYLAGQYRIEVDRKRGKEPLVDLLLDFFDEMREEREALNNLQVKGEEKKYVVARDEEIDLTGSDDFAIPEFYNGDTHIMAMVRDPNWAFAYWEIDEAKTKEIKSQGSRQGSQRKLILRVHDLEAPSRKRQSVYIDIPVKWDDRSWYINLPHAGGSYIIELLCRNRDKYNVLARSNKISPPRGSVSESGREGIEGTLIELSSQDLRKPTQGSSSIPQRVLSI